MSRDRDRAGPPARRAAPPGTPSLKQDFDSQSLHALRSAVAAHAAAAGLGRQRVYDVTAAAHELAANSVRHGPGHGRLQLWNAGGRLHIQVSEDGAAPAGNGRPPPDPASWQVAHGHGLWLASQVADDLAIDRGVAGITATVTFTIVSELPPQPRRLPLAEA